ncbi:MAG: bifunctional 3,4-dihydroxy-2-butanone-4-phosphate synthase/GTP cyclohydrolase II [Heliobacteriaceae bacterium]|nr:bifunctional 3,4-dihydroxy-2-butanone-4-phosphate synthase/GTP cyclohydrolase II [Heliobacteriaceae bacterium]
MFDTIESALEDFKSGMPVIVADDEDRENEGDLLLSAQAVTPEYINFMAKECCGLICLAISPEIAERLDLPQMVDRNTDSMKTAFTVSIDGAEKFGVTTGISAFDRAKTIEIAAAPDAEPSDLRRPGHIFPCTAKPGGVLQRTGHTEACVDLAKLAGHTPAGVMCEILGKDGSMARRDELKVFAQKHNIKFITVSDLIKYRIKSDKFVTREAEVLLPTQFGEFNLYGYRNNLNGEEHVALVKDDGSGKIPLIRVHSECLTGDIFHSLRCDCNYQLHNALRMINDYGKGALIYMKGHEGRGIGLVNKIKAYELQLCGQDTVDANISLGFKPDLRDYGVGAQIILDIGFDNFNLITNNPKKIIALNGYGLTIHDIIKTEPQINEYNERYMTTKKERMEHLFD